MPCMALAIILQRISGILSFFPNVLHIYLICYYIDRKTKRKMILIQVCLFLLFALCLIALTIFLLYFVHNLSVSKERWCTSASH